MLLTVLNIYINNSNIIQPLFLPVKGEIEIRHGRNVASVKSNVVMDERKRLTFRTQAERGISNHEQILRSQTGAENLRQKKVKLVNKQTRHVLI